MANELNLRLDPVQTGLTVTARVRRADGTQIGIDTACGEIVGVNGLYSGSFTLTSVADGTYLVEFFSGTTLLGTGELNVKNETEVFPYAHTNMLDEIETGMPLENAIRVILGAIGGKSSGFTGNAGDNIVYRDSTDAKNRISATVDQFGNRTVVSLDGTK